MAASKQNSCPYLVFEEGFGWCKAAVCQGGLNPSKGREITRSELWRCTHEPEGCSDYRKEKVRKHV